MRKESLNAADDWNDRHGYKDKPEKETFRHGKVQHYAADGEMTETPLLQYTSVRPTAA